MMTAASHCAVRAPSMWCPISGGERVQQPQAARHAVVLVQNGAMFTSPHNRLLSLACLMERFGDFIDDV